MSTRVYSASSNAKITVGSSATKQMLRLSVPSTCPDIQLLEASCTPFGVSATDPKARIQLVRTSNAGTFTAITPKQHDKGSAVASKVTAGHTSSSDATPIDLGSGELDIVWEEPIHGLQGFPWRLDHLGILVPSSGFIVLRVINGSAALDFIPRLTWRE